MIDRLPESWIPPEHILDLRAVARPARMVYEAGPIGYGFVRRARGGDRVGRVRAGAR